MIKLIYFKTNYC